jgi:hypothetical protein
MKAIVIAFSLKEQNFLAISERVKGIAKCHGSNVILIHGFMNKKEIKKRKLPDKVGTLFRRYFPIQLNMYNNGVLRKEMAETAKELGATVYVVGEIKGGVAEEVELYDNIDLKIINIPL